MMAVCEETPRSSSAAATALIALVRLLARQAAREQSDQYTEPQISEKQS
jgi:hypothetical protein